MLVLATVAAVACGSRDRTTEPPPPPVSPFPSFVRLRSDAGDVIGGGKSYDYTPATALVDVSANGNSISVVVHGDEQWTGAFAGPSTLGRLQRGTYANVQRYPDNDPTKGGLSWSGEGRGCNTLRGSFTADSVTYDIDGALTALDLTFEQHCEGSTTALHGTIHWRANDPTRPPGPVDPPPLGLWLPPAGSTPVSGDYVYLTSDVGDFIGGGRSYTYTQGDAPIGVTAGGGHLLVTVHGAEAWSGDFQVMSTLSQLQPGYYANLRRYPLHNPAKGGLSWVGAGRGCTTVTGWFAIDVVTYVSGSLTAIDLRFEQHCEGGTPALHGAVHWRA